MEKEHREDVLFHFWGFRPLQIYMVLKPFTHPSLRINSFRPLQIYMVLKLIHRRTALKLVFKNFIFDIEYTLLLYHLISSQNV